MELTELTGATESPGQHPPSNSEPGKILRSSERMPLGRRCSSPTSPTLGCSWDSGVFTKKGPCKPRGNTNPGPETELERDRGRHCLPGALSSGNKQ